MKYKGFTLIEILLVIVVLAVIGSLGINMYRKHAQTFRVNKTSIEIQHILEAAMSYNVHNGGVWPTAQTNCSRKTPLPSGYSFIDDYIPNGSAGAMSDLGYVFCWGNFPNTQRFAVGLKVDDQQIAKRIAARLPNAITTSDETVKIDPPPCTAGSDCFVRSEVTTPGATSQQTGGMGVAAVGYCNTDASQPVTGLPASSHCILTTPQDPPNDHTPYSGLITFACPANATNSFIITAPNFINVPSGGGSAPAFIHIESFATGADRYHCTLDANHIAQCVFTIDAQAFLNNQPASFTAPAFADYGPEIGLSYIGFCS